MYGDAWVFLGFRNVYLLVFIEAIHIWLVSGFEVVVWLTSFEVVQGISNQEPAS